MKVSIITVVFNAEQTIGDTLASVARQTYTNIEHIVIDGASTDNTMKVVSQFQGPLAQVLSEPDAGIYDAMNKGLSLATGDVVGFLNADDIYADENVVQKIAELHCDAELDACYADLLYFKDLTDTSPERAVRSWRSQDYQTGLCFRGWMPAHPTLYLKRRVFEKVGKFDVALGNQADLEFCARAFEVAHISSLYRPEVWVKMRTGGASQAGLLTMIKSNWLSYLALRKLGLRRDPISFFIIKFGSKLPQFFKRSFKRPFKRP